MHKVAKIVTLNNGFRRHTGLIHGFYRAMHYSAKRGLAITCRLSVCNVVDHDHIGWKSWKLIVRTISPTSLLFVAQGEHGEILWRLEVGWEKVACWSTKAAVSLKRVKIEEKLL